MDADGLDSRLAAIKLLSDVLEKKQALDLLMEKEGLFLNLARRDRGFVHMLVATTLRRLGQLDTLILRAMDQNTPPEPERLAHILRIGLCQILFMDVPNHAAVDTSVRAAQKLGLNRQKGLVNAVLRKLSETAQIWISELDNPISNIPHWLQKAWIDDYGVETAKDIAQASLIEAAIDITPKDPGMSEHWAHTLNAKLLPTGSIRLTDTAEPIPNLPGFTDGMWWVQDTAASLPVKILGDLSGKEALDMCAAPGGKTAQLASVGANVTALDRSHNRLKRLDENMKRLRLNMNISVQAADAAFWHTKTPYDVVLLDAPCSATGTLRRHPDVMHIKTKQDVNRLTETQARLLENALTLLKEGGVLVYCTCSLQKEEGENQIDKFLQKHSNVKRWPIQAAEIGGIESFITTHGDIRALPHFLSAYGGSDGFYVARLVKNS